MSDKSVKVLIVDDEPLIRMDLKEMLEELDFEVIAEAKDGVQAVELAKSNDPDLVFMDIRMPNMDGIEAAQSIQDELKRRIPIIMLTAYSQPELYEKASQAGAFAYLTKPLRKADLGPAIEIARSRAFEIDELSQEVNSLSEKLETRKLVEKAKGLLMKKLGLDEETAFRNMQKASMNKRISIKEVAQTVLENS